MQFLEPEPRWRWVRLGLWIVTLAAGSAGQFWLVGAPALPLAAAAWAVAAVGFVLLYFAAGASRSLPGSESTDMPVATEWGWLALVLAVGVFFICFRIGTIPAGLNHDAAWEGLYALRILDGEPYTPYTSEAWGRETMTFYFRAASAWWLGPTVLAVQAPGMVAGVLTLPFFYGWLRTMFGARLALVAALLLAVAGWHLIFSRSGWRSDYQPLFMAATCYFFFRGMRRAALVDFLLAGVALALTLNTYNGSRVFPGVFAAWLVLVVLQSWRVKVFVRRYGAGLAFMALAFAVTIAPLALYAANHWEIFMGRASALRGASDFGEALRATLLLFNFRGNGDDFFVGEPALELVTAVLFVFGLLWAILRLRDERAQFVLIGLAINLLPGLISKPNLNRNVGTMIFVFALAGMGTVFFARQLRVLVPRIGAAVAAVFLGAVCAAALVAGYGQYLGDSRRPVWGFYPETTVLGRYMHAIVPEFQIWVGGANFPRDSLTYLSYQGDGDPMRRNYTWVDEVRTLLQTTPVAGGGKGIAFILAAEGPARTVFDTLAQRYPQHEIEELRYPADGGKVFARALLVRSAAAAKAPVALPAGAGVGVVAQAPAGELSQPRGVALGSTGEIVVADFGHHRVQVFDPTLRFVRQWGSEGGEPGQFREPSDVAVGPNGQIYVADTWNGRVQAFSAEGRVLGQSDVALYGPRGVAAARDGGIYVADTGNGRIVAFNPELRIRKAWGEKGSAAGQLSEPVGIAVGPEGQVWVADNGNGRVQVFDREGGFVREFAVDGWVSTVFSEPRLGFDEAGILWVTVPREREIRAYSSAGTVQRVLRDPVATGFDMPLGLAIGAGRMLVAGINGRLGWLKTNEIDDEGADEEIFSGQATEE